MTAITERMMRAGRFTVDLIDSTPWSVLAEFRDACGIRPDGSFKGTDGHLVVTNARVPVGSLGDYGAVLYRGRLFDVVGRSSFAGRGLQSWLGAPDIPSPRTLGVGSGSSTLEEYVDGGGYGPLVNGITKGTVSATASEPQPGIEAYTTIIEAFDAAVRLFGSEWRLNNDMTLDAGPVEDLYPTTPQILFTDHPGLVGDVNGVRVIRSNALSPSALSSQRANKTAIVAAGEGFSAIRHITPAASPQIGIRPSDGAGVDSTRLINAPQIETGTEAAARARAVRDLWANPRTDFEIVINDDRWRQFVNPGELAYVWYPDAGIIDMDADPFPVAGQHIFPRTVRIQQLSGWSPSVGDGVYLVRTVTSGDDIILDVTDWVNISPGFAKVTVGPGNGAAELNQSEHDVARFPLNIAVAERLAR